MRLLRRFFLPLLLLMLGVNGAGWHALIQALVASLWLAAMFRRATAEA